MAVHHMVRAETYGRGKRGIAAFVHLLGLTSVTDIPFLAYDKPNEE